MKPISVLAFVCGLWLTPTLGVAKAFDCSRIVSLAPSVTEVLYELGLGDHIVGVTRFDKYPQQVMEMAKVGGLLDTNYEAILSLQPTILFALREHSAAVRRTKELGIPSVQVSHDSVTKILDSISFIGQACGLAERSLTLRQSLETEMHQILSQRPDDFRPKALVVIRGAADSTTLRSLYVSGNDGFYSELLKLAGAENAYKGQTISMPALSYEGLEVLSPDVIIEIVSGPELSKSKSREEVLRFWKPFENVKAVKNGKVYRLDSDYMSIPGPRFVRALRDIARVLWLDKGKDHVIG